MAPKVGSFTPFRRSALTGQRVTSRWMTSLPVSGEGADRVRTGFDRTKPRTMAQELDGERATNEALVGFASNSAMGGLKLIPVVGNLLNAVSFVADVERLGRLMDESNPSAADVVVQTTAGLFHAAGILVPWMGAIYDATSGAAIGINLAAGGLVELVGGEGAIDLGTSLLTPSLRNNSVVAALMDRLQREEPGPERHFVSKMD